MALLLRPSKRCLAQAVRPAVVAGQHHRLPQRLAAAPHPRPRLSNVRGFATGSGAAGRGPQIDPGLYQKVLKNGFPMFEEVTRQVEAQNPAAVLDLGTGPGEPALSIAKVLPNTAVTATDFQPGMVEQAKVRCRDFSNISYGVVSADDLSQFSSSSFDAVTMVYTLMFVKDREKCLREISRVLKPGGRAYIGVWKDFKFFQLGLEVLTELGNGRKPAPPINPMALSAPNAVESIVEKTAEVSVSASTEVITNFDAGVGKDACTISLLTMKTELERLAAEGIENVEEKYKEAFVRKLDERGCKTDSGYIIKGCLSQVLTIVKA